jgi:hypothetical protein
MPTWIERLLPPSPLARRLAFQSILFAIGDGAFLTGSAVFFTHIVGLSLDPWSDWRDAARCCPGGGSRWA